jgi:hypothetical protein
MHLLTLLAHSAKMRLIVVPRFTSTVGYWTTHAEQEGKDG